jgi:hypothetical protein
MAEPLDVTTRLAEGRPAVDTIGDYVWACHLLGYQNADLTLHAAQVRDWYGGDDGLDLRALEADRAALSAAAAATDSACQLQERQLDALAGAWRGRGGDATYEFLIRHGEASAAATLAVRDAVDALATLRDDLWHAVDEKVSAAVAIDDRRDAERAQWLAATHTVTTGAGDRAVASELIDQQVKPFVDNDIRSDWVTAMQKAMTAVSAAFDAATNLLTAGAAAPFEVPGDLGPSSSLPPPPPDAPPVQSAGTAPAAWPSSAPAGWPSPAPLAPPAAAPMAPVFPAAPEAPTAAVPAAPAPATAPVAATPASPTMPSLGEMGGGLPGGAGGLAGLGTQLADAIGGLLDRPGDALPDPPEIGTDETVGEKDVVSPDESVRDDDEVDDESGDDESDADASDLAEADEPSGEPVNACPEMDPDEPPPAEPVPTPPPAPMPPPQPVVQPPPDAEPLAAETPCEIAADELPQAGP